MNIGDKFMVFEFYRKNGTINHVALKCHYDAMNYFPINSLVHIKTVGNIIIKTIKK